MKKTVYILGITCTLLILAGSLFKGLHLPGASIMLLLGAILVVFGFLPLFFYISYKEHQGNKSIVLPLGAFIATALLLTGALFKVLHYPFAREILLVGSVILLVGFLPVYLVSVFRKSQETRNWSAYILLVILFGAVILMINTTRISSTIIDKYKQTSMDARQTKDFFLHQTDSLYKLLSNKYPSGDITLKLNQMLLRSDEINQLILDIRSKLLSTSGNETEENLKNAHNERYCYLVLQKKKTNIQLFQKVVEYKEFLIKNTISDQSKKMISVLLSNYDRFENLPLIIVLTKLNELDRNVKMAEYESLNGLANDSKQ